MTDPDDNAPDQLTLYHLVLFQQGTDRRGSLNRHLVQSIQGQLDATIKTPPERTAIDVWVESPGGDAHATYKLVLDLKHRCRRLRAVVPDFAKSAATLLMLGMDSIFMAPAAELGPLDAQIEHPSKEGLIVSALDVADSLESLGRTAMDMALSSGASIIAYTGLTRIDVLQAVLRFMARFLQPAIEKLDPHLIHQAANQLKVAERYAMIMLANRDIPEHQTMNADSARDFVQGLVNAYPAHEFVISRAEARKLGLPIEHAESYPRWDVVQRFYGSFLSGKQSMINIYPDSDFDEENESSEVSHEEADGLQEDEKATEGAAPPALDALTGSKAFGRT